MYKIDGLWQHDFRLAGLPRYHCSYGRVKKADAERLHAAVSALFRAAVVPVIEAMRAGRLSADQVAECHASGRAFETLLVVAPETEPWPSIEDACDEYCEAVKANTNRKPRTAVLARSQCDRFLAYLDRRDQLAGAAAGTSRALPLDGVGSGIVEDYQRFMLEQGYKRNTITAYVARVGSVFQWYRRRENRLAAEAKRAARPLHIPLDPDVISTAKENRTRYLRADEAEQLLAATPAPLLFPVAAGMFAGLRIEEMLHLRTGFDVDLDLGVLSVQRQPTWEPKTKRSVRHVPIANALKPLLELHLKRYASEEWVTPAMTDPTRPLNPGVFSSHFRKIVKNADLIAGDEDPMGVTYHTLRHTFASWLLMSGTDPFTVAKLLGNTVKMVEDTYGHLAKDYRQAAVDRLGGGMSLPMITEQDVAKPATENATTAAPTEALT